MSKLVIKEVPSASADLAYLIAKLDRYLEGIYPAEEIFSVDFSDPKTEEMVFAVAYWDGVPVGCGGIRRLEASMVELKRFFVEPDMRRKGIAKSLFHWLEQRAGHLGCAVMRLETGAPQVESVAFYSSQGFYEIERFGEYVDCHSSFCMEKKIAPC
ncbi:MULTISPECIES: GNAT family N-acetyltransferase [unclassified Paenibacillus]|uniref:GNAT family N-acetyltransferase n=1 Tax=unclassified Paenibacillus TaxID=185978 RepID=UPI0036D288AA